MSDRSGYFRRYYRRNRAYKLARARWHYRQNRERILAQRAAKREQP